MLIFGEHNSHIQLMRDREYARIIANRFINAHKADYVYITQRSNGAVYLHNNKEDFRIDGLKVEFGQAKKSNRLVRYHISKYTNIYLDMEGTLIAEGAKMDNKTIQANNRFINEHKHNYTHVSQRADGAVYLHNKEFKQTVEVMCPQYGQKYLAATFDVKKWNKIWINSSGVLLADELKPPYKHAGMIVEWLASGRTRVVEQSQTFGGNIVWTEDTNPTWLADNYRFAPDMYDVVFYRFEGDSKIYKAEALPHNAIAVYQTKSEVRPTCDIAVNLETKV